MNNNLYSFLQRLEPLPSLVRAWQTIQSYPGYIADLRKFRSTSKQNLPMYYTDLFPQLQEKTPTHGFDAHYIYHTAWAARVLARTKPKVHVDISSSLYFCSIVSAFIPIKFYDYRPANLQLSGLKTAHNDLTNLSFKTNSQKSLSCMHTVEHIGLGRYGDPIDPEGDIQAMKELSRVLAPGGNLLFVTPIGREAKVMFNAHRIYNKNYIVKQFADLQLKEFALISADGSEGIVTKNYQKILAKNDYCCGCFWFTKPKQ